MASDGESEYGYDLSLEDEELLASLVDGVHAANNGSANTAQIAGVSERPHVVPSLAPSFIPHHAPKLPPGGSQGTASLVGIARTDSVDAFVQNTQPQSAPSFVPADDVTYPDCRCLLLGLLLPGRP